MEAIPPHEGELVICAGGPNLTACLPEIRRRHKSGATVVAINATLEYLIQNGITPWGCILADGGAVLADQVIAYPGVQYLVATQCHPAVFDKLEGQAVRLWHADTIELGTGWEPLFKLYGQQVMPISGGSTAALRSLHLGYVMGFRDFHYYGLDGSVYVGAPLYTSFWSPEREIRHHAYEQRVDDDIELFELTITDEDGGEKKFWTRKDYARQAQDFIDTINKWYEMARTDPNTDQIAVQVHGEGMIPYIWRKRRRNLGRS